MASTKNDIIYPDDYNKAADILADMKVLADSVDGNIEQINSNIQENTENIKLYQEEIKKLQSENIEAKAENERLKSDIESISLVGEAEGESIDLNDSSNARFNKFEIGGNHKQESREGYNLLNNVLQSQTINGLTVTVNDDKSVKVAGTATANTNLVFDRHGGKIEAGTYTLKDCQTFVESDENKGWWTEGQTRTFTSEVTISGSGFYKYYAANTVVNETLYPMLIAGSELKPYEPYGAMPSPDYPSEVKTVKDSVEVKVVNKNFFDINKITQNIFYWQNQNQITSNSNWNMSDYIKASKNDNFTISFKLNNSTDTQINYSYYNSDKKLIGGIGSQTITTTKSFTIIDNQDIKYIRVGYRNDKGMYDIQIEKGSTATDFVEHQEQTITMPVQQEMLQGDYFDWVNEKEVHIWNKIESYSGETITSEYISTTGQLTTGATIYYKLSTPTQLDFTDEQKAVAKQIKETLHTYKNVTHIYSDDEVSPIVNVEYAKDPNAQNNNLQNQIDEIKQLISTTQTSAMLLDNLQKEVESEVE